MLKHIATVFPFPLQHFAERDPLGSVFGAFQSQFSNLVHLHTQMDKKQMGNFVEIAIVKISTGFLDDEVYLMWNTPNSKNGIRALTFTHLTTNLVQPITVFSPLELIEMYLSCHNEYIVSRITNISLT